MFWHCFNKKFVLWIFLIVVLLLGILLFLLVYIKKTNPKEYISLNGTRTSLGITEINTNSEHYYTLAGPIVKEPYISNGFYHVDVNLRSENASFVTPFLLGLPERKISSDLFEKSTDILAVRDYSSERVVMSSVSSLIKKMKKNVILTIEFSNNLNSINLNGENRSCDLTCHSDVEDMLKVFGKQAQEFITKAFEKKAERNSTSVVIPAITVKMYVDSF